MDAKDFRDRERTRVKRRIGVIISGQLFAGPVVQSADATSSENLHHKLIEGIVLREVVEYQTFTSFDKRERVDGQTGQRFLIGSRANVPPGTHKILEFSPRIPGLSQELFGQGEVVGIHGWETAVVPSTPLGTGPANERAYPPYSASRAVSFMAWTSA